PPDRTSQAVTRRDWSASRVSSFPFREVNRESILYQIPGQRNSIENLETGRDSIEKREPRRRTTPARSFRASSDRHACREGSARSGTGAVEAEEAVVLIAVEIGLSQWRGAHQDGLRPFGTVVVPAEGEPPRGPGFGTPS